MTMWVSGKMFMTTMRDSNNYTAAVLLLSSSVYQKRQFKKASQTARAASYLVLVGWAYGFGRNRAT